MQEILEMTKLMPVGPRGAHVKRGSIPGIPDGPGGPAALRGESAAFTLHLAPALPLRKAWEMQDLPFAGMSGLDCREGAGHCFSVTESHPLSHRVA